MAGSFKLVAESINLGEGFPNLPGHIYFSPHDGLVPLIEEQKLKRGIEEVAGILRRFLGTNSPKFRERFAQLLALAQLGLVRGDVKVALLELDDMKASLVNDEGQAVRAQYLSRLGLIVITACVIFIVLGFFAYDLMTLLGDRILVDTYSNSAISTQDHTKERILSFAQTFQNYAFMLSAAMPALWLTFALRREFSFEHLFLPERDLLGPLHRVAFVAVATVILAVFCSARIAGVYIGGLSTEAASRNLLVALVFGFLCGLGQGLLADLILPHVRRFGAPAPAPTSHVASAPAPATHGGPVQGAAVTEEKRPG